MSQSRTVNLTTDVNPDDAAEIDRLGNSQEDYEVAKAAVKKYEAEMAVLLGRIGASVPPDSVSMVVADNFVAEVSACSNTRTVKDVKRLVELLTPQVYLQLAKVGITDICKYVPEHQLPEVLETARSKSRSLKLIRRNV